MNAPLYTLEILRLAASLKEPVALERVDGRAELRSQTCGSIVAVEIMVDEHGKIAAVSQRVHACAFGQASAAVLEQQAIGRTGQEVEQALSDLEHWLAGCHPDTGTWPGLEALAPARSRKSRHGAILLPFRALAASLK